MHLRQLSQNNFAALKTCLSERGETKPLCPSVDVKVTVNSRPYTVTIQLDRKQRVFVLYAVYARPGSPPGSLCLFLVEDRTVLSGLLDLIVYEQKTKATENCGQA